MTILQEGHVSNCIKDKNLTHTKISLAVTNNFLDLIKKICKNGEK